MPRLPVEQVAQPTDDNGQSLTDAERKAIASLERLAKKWPRSLTLLSAASSLYVVRSGVRPLQELAHISGIPNDGGDPDWSDPS